MEELLEAAKDLSPWLIGFLAVVWLIDRALKIVSSRKAAAEMAEMRDAHNRLEESIQNHDYRAADISNQTLRALTGIEQQLVVMNSGKGTISAHNQKKMIEYQVSWCKDLTLNAIITSIRKNNIKDREDVVLRRILHAFKAAAEEAKNSLDNLDGMTYQYAVFFEELLPQIWDNIIRAAIPLYHRDLAPGTGIDEAVDDFSFRIQEWFNEALSATINRSEDPDTGTIYRRGKPEETGEFGPWLPLAHKLKSYKPQSGSGYEASDHSSRPSSRRIS